MSTGIYLEAENIRISIDKTKTGLWPHIRNIKNLMFPIPLFVRVLSAVNHILLRWFICCLKVDLKVKNQVKAPLQFTPYKCHRHNRIGKIQIAEYDNWKRSLYPFEFGFILYNMHMWASYFYFQNIFFNTKHSKIILTNFVFSMDICCIKIITANARQLCI